MKGYVVVEDGKDMIMCLGYFERLEEAVGEAFLHANEIMEEGGIITPILNLEGETGLQFSYETHGEKSNIYILFDE